MSKSTATPVVAIVSCTRKHTYELVPALLSLATHAPRAHVHLFADQPGRDALAGCESHLHSILGSLSVHTIEELGAPMLDYDPRLGPSPKFQTTRFACASAKLMLQAAPALLPHPHVLALDVDTVANEDVGELWRWTRSLRASPTALWGLVRESSGDEGPLTFGKELKDVRPSHLPAREYYNTGVVLLYASRLRALNLTHPAALLAQLSAAATRGKGAWSDFGLGEQNLLNAWLAEHPGRVTQVRMTLA